MRFLRSVFNNIRLLFIRIFNIKRIVLNNREYFVLDLDSPNFYEFRSYLLKYGSYIPVGCSDGLVKSYVLNVFDCDMCFAGYTKFYFDIDVSGEI